MIHPASRRKVRWERIDRPGTEVATLSPLGSTWHLHGRVDVDLEGVASKIVYEVVTDTTWSTRTVVVRLKRGTTRRRLGMSVDDEGRWHDHGRVRNDLTGCVDADLEITPATNTLPIRRLNLRIGEDREISAAWVRFPQLTVERTRQRYRRVEASRYRFENLDSGFRADLGVDDAGLVVTYSDAWRRPPVLSQIG